MDGSYIFRQVVKWGIEVKELHMSLAEFYIILLVLAWSSLEFVQHLFGEEAKKGCLKSFISKNTSYKYCLQSEVGE